MPSNDPPYGATWRSGYATVCKTVYSGSIPDVASNSIPLKLQNNLIRGPFQQIRFATALLPLARLVPGGRQGAAVEFDVDFSVPEADRLPSLDLDDEEMRSGRG